MTMPVELNSPINILQANSQCTEYIHILDTAAEEESSQMRLALVATYIVAGYSPASKCIAKPFNPLLGETFEIVTDKFVFLNEQVSHHPPICAGYCRGKHFSARTNCAITNKFNGRFLEINELYRSYITLDVKTGNGDERVTEHYEIILPTLSVHNLVFGNMYLDLGDRLTIRNLDSREYVLLDFNLKGFFTKAEEGYCIDGKVYSAAP